MAMHAGTSQSIPGPLDAAHVDAAAITGLWPLPPACARGIGDFRATWGTKDYAAAATVIATGRLHGLTALTALRAALAGQPVMRTG